MKNSNDITTLIEECSELMTIAYGKGYVIGDINNDDGKLCGMITKDFCFHFQLENEQEPGLFYLSFLVGTKGNRASEVTKLLCTIINYEYIYNIEDFYWDSETDKMVFGEDAIHQKYKAYLDKRGKKHCPVCDAIHPKKRFTEEGVCEICDKTILNDLTWH